MKFEWEILREFMSNNFATAGSNNTRAKVFGGWIVRTFCWDEKYNMQSESSVFVPDAKHEWEVTED
jgi:hypothetical protein